MPHELLKGFLAFRQNAYEGSSLMPDLVKQGQDPHIFIISCIDSRSNPGTVFSAAPGTFFSHQAMGAIVRPYKKGTALAAALQFAINYNNVEDIVVLGHTGCGAIKALVDEIEDEEIASFVTVAKEGLENARSCCADDTQHDDIFRHAEEQIVLQSTKNLESYPSVKKALSTGKVNILSWLFDMEDGALYQYDKKDDAFKKLT